MADEIQEELEELFDRASTHVRGIGGTLESGDLLFFYGRFKQAKEGRCTTSKPWMWDIQGKQKWESWKSQGDKSRNVAMREYVTHLSSIDPDWLVKSVSGTGPKGSGGFGVAVSVMSNPDTELSNDQKTLFDWCKEGNAAEVKKMLSQCKGSINEKDSEGMALIHWVCDRGHGEIMKVLLKYDADINIQDSDGQTPLHYAASCSHMTVIQLLLAKGADREIKDSDGATAAEVTDDNAVKQMLCQR